MLELYSKYQRFSYGVEWAVCESWAKWFDSVCKCSGCPYIAKEGRLAPRPVEVVLCASGIGVCGTTSGAPTDIYSAALRAALEPFWPDTAVWGDCYELRGDRRVRIPYATLQVPASEHVNAYRGPRSSHRMCPECGRIISGVSMGGYQAILSSQVGDRRLVVDNTGAVYIEPSLLEECKLRERFEDLRTFAIRVIDAPLDDWVLPTDPGWDGVLRTPESWLARERDRIERNRRIELGEIDPFESAP